MYIDSSTVKTKYGTYTRHLLRMSYRSDGKVKHKTIASLGECTQEEIRALKLALSKKHKLEDLINIDSLKLKQGISCGSVLLLNEIANRLGIAKALGSSKSGKLALFQILARIIGQGSRLSTVRLAQSHAFCDVLKLDSFNEDDLYENLKWISTNQSIIEDKLIAINKQNPTLFLYDITSSYFEGTQNELGDFGYNRDGKRGKKQIVIGLICDEEGDPLTVEVFKGNTADCSTVEGQIQKLKKRFNDAEIVLVGDKGMIKNTNRPDVFNKCHYITTITKAQIETLLKNQLFPMSLFDTNLSEIVDEDGVRYILRKNPFRAEEISKTRDSKLKSLEKKIKQRNAYIDEHPRADLKKALQDIETRIKKLKINDWVNVTLVDRHLILTIDTEGRLEAAKLDGCYVIKTDVSNEQATKEVIHARYKDLAKVEWAFRESKSDLIGLRPIFVRKEQCTRGHVFIAMLAYKIIRYLRKAWSHLDITVEEAINKLSALTTMEVKLEDRIIFNKIPEAREDILSLVEAAKVIMPEVLSSRNVIVSTRKKLSSRRKNPASKPS